MYYGAGNYEAFVRPRKHENADSQVAHVIGGGLAGLAACVFLLRDGYLKGENIHLYDRGDLFGGALDGAFYNDLEGYCMRGGREMDDHFECLFDLFRSIPSIENPELSVLDEYYYINKDDPNYSNLRVIEKCGQDAHTDKKYQLSDNVSLEILKLFFTPDTALYDMKISEVLSEEAQASNFWLYFRTMFAFEPWHSALELKLYLKRYIHHIDGLADLSALRFTKYNQYDSLVKPILNYLRDRGVNFHLFTAITNIDFKPSSEVVSLRSRTGVLNVPKQLAVSLSYKDLKTGIDNKIIFDDATNNFIFITNGSCVENSSLGSHDQPAKYNPNLSKDTSFALWKDISKISPDLGHPEKFISKPEKTAWISASMNLLDDEIAPYVEKICGRELHTGKTVTGGIVSVRDSSWLMSFTFNRQPQFPNQPENVNVGWLYGLNINVKGDFIKKPMIECTGEEITAEWLYHMGVPTDKIAELSKREHINTIPCMMPYITAFFMPRRKIDRPLVVPKSSCNFAFLGQFCHTDRDTVFTTEYSVRTAMEAVYTLLNVERAVPEVWASCYDIRELLKSVLCLRDGKKITDLKLNMVGKMTLHKILDFIKNTDVEVLLKKYGLL